MIEDVRSDALIIALVVVTTILVVTHPRALKKLSSGSFSAWSALRGRPEKSFERASDVIRGCLIGGVAGGSYCAIALDWSMPTSIVLGAFLGIMCFSALRSVIAAIFLQARSPGDRS